MTRTPATILETERLVLRPLTLDDLDALAALYREPGLGYFPPETEVLEATREELEGIIGVHYAQYGFGLWATLDRATGRFIGRCGLIPWTLEGEREVEVAYHLAPSCRGRGLATEAAAAIRDYGFERLELPRLVSVIDPDNPASVRVAEKIGMRLERTLDGLIYEGRPALVYALEAPRPRTEHPGFG
jgi:[ribosomal protein S5]-alanine N-acetyltransferase